MPASDERIIDFNNDVAVLRNDNVRVTAKAEYACLALIALTQLRPAKGPVHVKDIAEAQGIPLSSLTQILLKLKSAGLVTSTRGSTGGYWLARAPEEIRLGDVLRAIDGYNGVTRELPGPSAHALAAVWALIRDSETRILEQTSIAQLASQTSPFDWVI